MKLATDYLPYSPRSLADCCSAAGWSHENAHDALADAHAASRLLQCYLARARGDEPWLHLLDEAPTWRWPAINPPAARIPIPRGEVVMDRALRAEHGGGEGHFLSKLVPGLPRVPEPPMADAYLGVLDDVLADRKVDVGEGDALVALALDLGLDRAIVHDLHSAYLTSLGRAAWEDGIVTDLESNDLREVALLLGLPSAAVEQALTSARLFTGGDDVPTGSLRLSAGDRVCFTGQMSMSRDDLEALAVEVGLCATSSVSSKTAMLICADADSQSGKAKKARAAGVVVISEPKFHQLIQRMRVAAS